MDDALLSMGSRYLAARMAAAKYNERLSTQAGAAELLEVDPATLGRWERGEMVPSNHNVGRMAALYNAPDLKDNYCAHACPLGIGRVKPVNIRPVEQVVLRLSNVSRSLEDDVVRLMEIAEDGVIEEDEKDGFDEIVQKLAQISDAINVLKIVAERWKGGNANDA